MGTALTNSKLKDTYKDLLHLDNSNSGVDGTFRSLTDGLGTASPLMVSTGGVSVGDLGGGDCWFRLGSHSETIGWHMASSKVVFNEVDDDLFAIGWNVRHANEAPLVEGEPCLYMGFEANYDYETGADMEYYIQYSDGNGENSRRLYQGNVNRATHACTLQMQGQTYFYNSEQDAINFTILDAGGAIINRGGFQSASVGGTAFISQRNAGDTAYQSLIYLDENDRARVPSLMATATAVGKHTSEFMAIPDQTGNLATWSAVGGGVLSRVSVGGYLMTRVTTVPADGDLAASECALWFDDTNGAGKLMVKAKTANGTVVTGEVALT